MLRHMQNTFLVSRQIWSPDSPKPHWWARVWLRFEHWMMEPVDFPGKWPAQEPPAERYNSESPSTSDSRVNTE